MPAIIAKSIAILSDAGLGMAMFSLGMPFFITHLGFVWNTRGKKTIGK